MKKNMVVLFVWIAIAGPLFLLCDGMITYLYYGHIENETVSLEKAYRVKSSIYDHGLRPSFHGKLLWGSVRKYDVYTNNLGMKDSRIRNVTLKEGNKKRILFIGDSFTEGVGLPWEKTFVGQFAKEHPEIEVLNAGVSSYAPSVYYRKIKYLIGEKGLQVDKVVVFIDISDIQDEVYYRNDKLGNVILEHPPTHESTKDAAITFLRKHFYLTYSACRGISKGIKTVVGLVIPKERSRRVFNLPRGAWTLKDRPAWKGVNQYYLPLGIDGAIAKAKAQMSNLYKFLASKNIPLSVAVYPWPTQLYYNDENSLQVRIWKDWCDGKCSHFINLFPDFFNVKKSRHDWYKYLFLNGDVHYNENGHRIIAERLAKVFGDTK